LSAREAKELVELVPDVQAARMRGDCPALSLFASESVSTVFRIEARGSCWHPGDPSSLLINNYTVNRKTGVVTLHGSNSALSNSAIREKARTMLNLAKGRLLSVAESRCIAVEGAKIDFAPGGERNTLSVTNLSPSDEDPQNFLVVARAVGDRFSIVRQYSVSRETGAVRNEQSGSEVLSASIGTLRSKILAQREIPTLSLEDAMTVALHVPSILARLSDGCSEADASDNNASADEIFIAIRNRCPGAPNEAEIAAAVNMLTGVVSDPRTFVPLKSSEADEVARKALLRIETSRQSDGTIIDALCRSGQ
jgi:hypothetical protein